mgnify:CR=1 FL=1
MLTAIALYVVSDIYGFISWGILQKRQQKDNTVQMIAINAEELETLKLIIVTALTDEERKILNMYYAAKR